MQLIPPKTAISAPVMTAGMCGTAAPTTTNSRAMPKTNGSFDIISSPTSALRRPE